MSSLESLTTHQIKLKLMQKGIDPPPRAGKGELMEMLRQAEKKKADNSNSDPTTLDFAGQELKSLDQLKELATSSVTTNTGNTQTLMLRAVRTFAWRLSFLLPIIFLLARHRHGQALRTCGYATIS